MRKTVLMLLVCVMAFASCMTEKKMVKVLEAKYNMWPKTPAFSVPHWRYDEYRPMMTPFPLVVPANGILIDSFIPIPYVQDSTRVDTVWIPR